MKLSDYFLGELDREANRTRAVLLQVPPDKYEWKPHDKSMKFGSLSDMVATIPNWVAIQVTKDELDLAPADGSRMKNEPKTTSAALVAALDASLETARAALQNATEEQLTSLWRLKAGGKVVQEAPRYQMIQDTFNHWSHHRGQMTVYLRLLDAKVPATFGRSADEMAFR